MNNKRIKSSETSTHHTKKNATSNTETKRKTNSQQNEKPKYCSNCGSRIVDQKGNFCSKCGKKIVKYYDLEGQRRKDLVKALGEILLWEPKYLGAPTFSYEVGNYIVTKIGAIICPESCTREIAEQIILKLKERGFEHAGIIRYNGIEYDGAHEALIDLETFNKVQNIIQSHHNGERTREHPHFLKGLVYCWNCKSRMVVTHAKSHTGNVYPYFICAGRHRTKSSRQTCKMRSILIDEVEYQLENSNFAPQKFQLFNRKSEIKKQYRPNVWYNVITTKHQTHTRGLHYEQYSI